ncbi:hypothetical protein [Pseudochryseolinea flava]|uniref:Uncharacterized protein n=1 Tax=Pseudochryseolinea flava TaxID=2059302 RepID=A0A364Y441_9BACT|nr:hypothetical protein [Pseudochryseolinea flava]RAW01094.1 hypothetical protein DQQ10_12765 [Pseudochryseolinea flava]
MEKMHIVNFLRERKKGAYAVLVEAYADIITSTPITLALKIVRDDLERECHEVIELKYFSFAKAVARFKKRSARVSSTKPAFKDAIEENNNRSVPGRFKI